PVLGLGNVIPASSRIVPASHISQVAYRFNGIDYLSEDYYKADLSQITRTGYYTAWTQDKAFVHNGVIYAPFMLAFRHGYDDLRIAWVKSFDNGNTWTTPEILMDYHPQNPTLGWHCFSMGIVGNRLFMLVEERDVASKKMVRSFLYSRVMTKNFFVTGGISQSGNVVTVELEEHGLFVGDSISFSNSGISGVSGKMTVTSVLDANRFTVMNSKEQTITNNDSWLCATYFEDNQWQIQELSTFANSAGVAATHLHSFCPVNRSQFAFGFHNGDASPREIGFVKCSINWATGRVTTDKIILSETLSRAAAEPCLRYYKNKLFLTTRSQNPNVGSLLIRCDLNGENISSFNISTEKIHYTNMPFHIENDVIYMFAAERAENEWETGQSDKSGNRYRANRPRMFLLKHRLSDWGKPEKTEVQVISQGIYSGEAANSACGVGSIVYKDGILHCLFGDEDYRNSHSLTENARKANNAHIDSGYQPEIYSLRIVIDKQMAGVTDKPLRGADNLHLPVFRGTDGVRTVQSPVRFSEKVEFDNAVALAVATVGRILASSKAGADYAMYGTDYLNDANRLYLSSTHQANSQNGSTITLHNDKSEEGSIIDYRATAHKFLGGVHINTGVINTPPESAGNTEIVNAKWVNSQIEKNNTEKVLFSGSTQEPVSVQVSSLRGQIHVLASIRGVKRWDSFSLWSSNNTYIGASEYGGENADRNYGSLIRVSINDRTLTLTPTSTYLPTIKKIIHLGA
ncbi:TPA: hypothetical protein PW575_002479, partial [Mannheimia haemolytica]|nr:hypothetical protein [Mannheimia haemolytica]